MTTIEQEDFIVELFNLLEPTWKGDLITLVSLLDQLDEAMFFGQPTAEIEKQLDIILDIQYNTTGGAQ